MWYILADESQATVYGPYADKVRAETDARRIQLGDWYAWVVGHAEMLRETAKVEAAGHKVVHKTALPPRKVVS